MLAMSKTHCIPSRITYSIPTSLAVLLEVYRITVQVIQHGLVFQRIRLFGKELKLATPTICRAPSLVTTPFLPERRGIYCLRMRVISEISLKQ